MKLFARYSVVVIFVGAILSSCAPSTISSQPRTQQFADGKHWVLTRSIDFETDEDTKITGTVPKGFVTDYASVPRVFWSVVPRHGRYSAAAVVHDYLYWTQTTSREDADKVMKELMKFSEVSDAQRETIYTSLRAGGSFAWRSNKRKRERGDIRIVPEDLIDEIPFGMTWAEYQQQLQTQKESGCCIH